MTRSGEVIRTVLLAAIAGSAVGVVAGIVGSAMVGESATAHVVYSLAVGAATGAAASLFSLAFMRHAGRHPRLSFGAVALVTAAGALMGAYGAGVREGHLFIAILAVSEAIGFLITLFWYGSYRRLNRQLAQMQRAITEGEGHD